MSGSRYTELVRKLQVRADHRRGVESGEISLGRTIEDEAAEAIKELLSLVGDLAEALEPLATCTSTPSHMFSLQGAAYRLTAIHPVQDADLRSSDIIRARTVLQKAREATGEANG